MKVAFVTDTHFGYRRFESDAYAQGKEAILAAAILSSKSIAGKVLFFLNLLLKAQS